MFLVRPRDLLELLRVISNPISKFAAGSLPPDVRIEDVFVDETRGLLGLMLESEWFDPVEVTNHRGRLSANWPRAIFDFAPPDSANEEGWSESESDFTDAPAKSLFEELQEASARDFHLRALTFSAQDLLLILRSQNARALPEFPLFPPETHVLGSVANEKLGAWTLWLEHPDFDPCKVGEEGGVVYVEIPGESSPNAPGEMSFRIQLPGATIERKTELDLDELGL